MAGVVPTYYQYDTPNDATRIALGRTIGQSGEVADFVERPNFLYASSNLRAIFERYYLPALETTSTTAIVLPLYYSRMSTTRDELEVFTGGSNCTVTVGIYTTGGSHRDSLQPHPQRRIVHLEFCDVYGDHLDRGLVGIPSRFRHRARLTSTLSGY